jgi:hypothetical protein
MITLVVKMIILVSQSWQQNRKGEDQDIIIKLVMKRRMISSRNKL